MCFLKRSDETATPSCPFELTITAERLTFALLIPGDVGGSLRTGRADADYVGVGALSLVADIDIIAASGDLAVGLIAQSYVPGSAAVSGKRARAESDVIRSGTATVKATCAQSGIACAHGVP